MIPKTGQLLQRVPFTINVANPYDNIITDDGNFWAGGSAAQAGDTIELMDTRTGKLLELHSPSHDSTPARGGFDAQGNPWFGGRGGSLLQLDVKARQIREFAPPTPVRRFLRGSARQEGRSMGRRAAWRPHGAVQSQRGSLDRIRAAGALLA